MLSHQKIKIVKVKRGAWDIETGGWIKGVIGLTLGIFIMFYAMMNLVDDAKTAHRMSILKETAYSDRVLFETSKLLNENKNFQKLNVRLRKFKNNIPSYPENRAMFYVMLFGSNEIAEKNIVEQAQTGFQKALNIAREQ